MVLSIVAEKVQKEGRIDEETEKKMEELQKKIIELNTEHLLELQNIQVDADLQIEEVKLKLEKNYDNMTQKYKPGEAPGEILHKNDMLLDKCADYQYDLEVIHTKIKNT